jgi:hypothetical protein
LSVPEPEKRKVELGPLFTAGAFLALDGLLRRSVLVAAAGLGAIWLDQRTELGRRLKVQYVEDDRDQPGGPS